MNGFRLFSYTTLFVFIAIILTSGILIASEDTESEVRFAILGDTQFAEPPMFERMAHEINMLRPDFAIQVGDLINGYTHDKETVRKEWEWYKYQIAPLECPFYPVPGNHDTVTPESEEVYAEIWGPDKYYYSFDKGPVHCVVIDCWYKESNDRIDEKQMEWIKNDIEKYAEQNGGKGSDELKEKSIFAFLHSPLWRYKEDHPGRQDWDKVHEMFKQYPVKMVVAGHTHEYVWENRDGIDYVVVNSAGGREEVERAGFFFGFIHASVLSGGDVKYGVIKAGSVLPLDTVNNHDRGTVPRYNLSGGTIRVEDWPEGKKLDRTVSVDLKNNLDEPRTYKSLWHVPRGADMNVEPFHGWIELGPKESKKLTFKLTSEKAPGKENLPWLEISTEKDLRTGYVSRDWEEKYRREIERKKAGEDIRTTAIPLEKSYKFDASYYLFIPPSAKVIRRSGDIVIDGKLNETAWEKTIMIDDFVQGDDEKAEKETQVRFLYDDDYFYAAVWMQEPNPDKLTTNAEGDIPFTWNDDDFEMFFDTGLTQSSYLRLFQNAAGTRFNSLPRHVENKYFKSDYESAIQKGGDFWTLEMKIPWSDLDLEDGPESGDMWAFNMGRHRQQSEVKQSRWAGGLYDPKRYGLLKFE